MDWPERVEVVDSHTEGEPTRVVVGGWAAPDGPTMAARRDDMLRRHDPLRQAEASVSIDVGAMPNAGMLSGNVWHDADHDNTPDAFERLLEGWTVELTEWHLAGPMLVAFIASLAMRQRLSRKRIQEFLNDWLHLYLGTATINQCIHEAGRAVEPVVEEQILPAVRQAELLYADETGWKEKSNALWLWVFTCATATLFIVGRRNREMLQRVLTDGFNGWLMSDGHWAYREYEWRLRCLAHLIRKARGLEQSCEEQAHLFGKRTLQVLETIMQGVYQAREGPPTVPLSKQHAIRLGKFWAFCERHWDAEHKKTRELAREFIYDWTAIWAVLDANIIYV